MKIDELIIYEDENVVAVNKPSGLLTIPDREGVNGLRNFLQEKYGNIFTVHRLDKDTSGIVVFAKNEAMHKHLSLQFENRETKKIYYGLVLGSPAQKTGVINKPLAEHPVKKGMMCIYKKGKESITEFEVLENFRLFSWVQFHILTGRTHQIRVHSKHIGNPIVSDPLYGDGKPVLISQLKKTYNLKKEEEGERPILNRLALHAAQLSFKGMEGENFTLEAPLPKDLKAVLNQLNKWKK
jgi:23S rRNA pseudouridine955/2504/2580 synthase/23S rRNA pseudouridine1911/1915/1917 synthase